MKFIFTTILLFCLISCNKKVAPSQKDLQSEIKQNPFEELVKNHPELKTEIDSLKATKWIFKKCDDCDLTGLNETILVGHSDRRPPKGEYYRKEVDLGKFNFETFEMYESEEKTNPNGQVYICYFDEKQKAKFKEFEPFYKNRITHTKQDYKSSEIGNTLIIYTYYDK